MAGSTQKGWSSNLVGNSLGLLTWTTRCSRKSQPRYPCPKQSLTDFSYQSSWDIVTIRNVQLNLNLLRLPFYYSPVINRHICLNLGIKWLKLDVHSVACIQKKRFIQGQQAWGERNSAEGWIAYTQNSGVASFDLPKFASSGFWWCWLKDTQLKLERLPYQLESAISYRNLNFIDSDIFQLRF